MVLKRQHSSKTFALAAYAVFAFVVALISRGRRTDGLLVCLLFPIVVAPLVYSRAVFLGMLGISLAASIAVVLPHLSRSLPAVVIVHGFVWVAGELLLRFKLSRDQAEKDLRASKEKYRLIVDNVAETVLVLDLNLHHVYASPSVFKLYGYTPEEFIALPLERILSPESFVRSLRVFEEEMALEVTGTADPRRSRAMESLEYRKDGSSIWIENNFSFIRDAESRVVHILCVAKDINERKQAEEALRKSSEQFKQLFESSPLAAVIYSMTDGRIMDVNTQFLELFEFKRAEVLGQTGLDLGLWSDPADRDRLVAHLKQQQEVRDFEARLRGKSGREHEVLLGGQVIDVSGEPMAILQSMDITERKQAEAKRASLEAQLRQSQKMEAIGTLAGGIAHDFNNILAAILCRVEVAGMGLPPEHPAHESLDEILKASLRARDLVRQILRFSRRQKQDRKLIDLGATVIEALKLLRASLRATIEIQTEIAPHLPPVLADATQVHQVIMNLGTNAGHAMSVHGGHLTITQTVVTLEAGTLPDHGDLPAGLYVRVSVQDTGCGMDAATVERIFEPFYTTKGPGGGTGLGLAVVHGIMENHDGAIAVESRPGEGTAFHLYFPAAEGAMSPDTESAPALPMGQREKILVVDDEIALVEIEVIMLEQLNYQVTGCHCAKDAIAAFRAQPNAFALVITDLTMPEVTGFDLAKELHQLRPGLPIILASGYSDFLGERTISQNGISAFLDKPFQLRSLAETIRRVLEEEVPER